MDNSSLLILLAHIYIIGPAFFLTSGLLIYSHYDGKRGDTTAIDVVAPVVSFLLGFVLISFLFYRTVSSFSSIRTNSKVKAIRLILSNLRVPGFWGSSVRNENDKRREKIKDRCAVFVFFGIFIILFVIFYTLMGVIMSNGTFVFQSNKIRLYNGVYSFKPEFPLSRNKTNVTLSIPNGGFVLTTKNPVLVDGPTISLSERNRVLHPDMPDLSFAYTFAPGTVVSLSLNTSTKMNVFYKVNDTVVKNKETTSSFELSFTETAFTSYLISVSCVGSDVSLVTYSFEAQTKVYDMTRATYVSKDTSFMVRQNDTILVWRNYSSSSSKSKEFIYIGVQTRDLLSDVLCDYQWFWINFAFISSAALFVFKTSLCQFIIFSNEGTFVQTEDQLKELKPFGFLNLLGSLLLIMVFFILGKNYSEDELKPAIANRTYRNFSSSIYSGTQFIIPASNYQPLGVRLRNVTDYVKMSAATEFPDLVSTKVVDCKPDTFLFEGTWKASYYISANYSLEWSFDSSKEVLVSLEDYYGVVVFNESYVLASKHNITVPSSGLYYLKIMSYESTDIYLVFNALNLYAPYFDFSKFSVYSHEGNLSFKKFDPNVKYLMLEPSKPNVTVQRFAMTLFAYDDYFSSLATGYAVSYAFIFVFLLLLIVAFIMLVSFYSCWPIHYTSSNDDTDEVKGDNGLLESDLLTDKNKTESTPDYNSFSEETKKDDNVYSYNPNPPSYSED